MTLSARALALILILAASTGEGGRLPLPLAMVHASSLALFLLAIIATVSRSGTDRPRGRGLAVMLLPCAALVLAGASAAAACYPYAAWLGFMDRVAAFGALAGAAMLLRAPSDLTWLRSAVVAATTLQALMAILGWWEATPAGAPAAFLNPNHLAAYLNIGLFLCAAALAGERARGGVAAASLWTAAAVAHLLASLLMKSRGGLLGLSVGGGLLLLLLWGRLSARSRKVCALALALIVVAGAALLYQRFSVSLDPDRYARLSIWKAGLSMARERPLLGVGPGGFQHEAPRHNFPRRSDPIRYGRSFRGAHSALLTHAAEDGVPAALLLLGTALGTMVLLWRRRGEGRQADAVLGTLPALAALLAQGLVEDLQQRPALLVTPALLLGSALASTRGWRGAPSPGRSRPLVAVALLLVGGYVAVAGIARPYLGWRSAQAARGAGRAGLSGMARAATLDPWNAEYHHDLAMAALNNAPPGPEPYAEAADQLQLARRLKPRDPRFPLLMARLESRAGRRIFDDPSRDAAAAELYAEAARLAPTDPRPHLERAAHLAEIGQVEEAVVAVEGALSIEPHYRRARILKSTLLLRLGRAGEAARSYEGLRASDRALAGYQADSGYAFEISSDEPAARAALEAALRGAPTTSPGSATD